VPEPTALDLWTRLADAAGRTLSPAQVAALDGYLDLLLEANQRMNLTRIDDRGSAEIEHVADALSLLRHLPAGRRVADVGSGGGVPGLPLAIVCPEREVTLIDSTGKKVDFLRRTADALGMGNVRTLAARAEDVGRGAARESFDVVVCRAVSEVVWLAEWCLPLLKVGGTLLAMKGPKAAEELARAGEAIRRIGGGRSEILPVDCPELPGRSILRIAKTRATDPAYPRSASVAKRRPLG
jgi:16S rRNA (guanine527-N7)-methyltransferase